MIEILGYNFLRDANALDATPVNMENITDVQLMNGIFDHFLVTRDVLSAFDPNISKEWDFNTILNANFNGNIHAGNIDALLMQITSIKVKRRVVGTFDWITLYDIPINTLDDFRFIVYDLINRNDEYYEYAFVPVLNNTEGNYISGQIHSEFDGVFVCDITTSYKFIAELAYGDTAWANRTAVFEPYGSTYPKIVFNGQIKYRSGTFGATLNTVQETTTKTLDRQGQVALANNISKFLINKKSKVLKDMNGNIYLITVVNNVTNNYVKELGNGLIGINFEWVEIGDLASQSDLYSTGLVNIPEGN